MAEEKMTILEAVQQAGEQLTKEAEKAPEVEQPKEEKKDEKEPKETTKEDPKEEVKDDEEELELMQAIQLRKILKDPVQALKFAQTLQSSLVQTPSDSRSKEVKDEAKSIIEQLEKAVGPDNQYLLEPVISIFNRLFEKREEIIAKEIKRIDNERLTERIENQTQMFVSENKVTEKEMDKLAELAKEFPQSSTITLPKYLNTLLKLVRADSPKPSGETKEEKKINVEKVNKNLASKKEDDKLEQEIKIIPRPKDSKITPRQAMEMAMKGEKFEE